MSVSVPSSLASTIPASLPACPLPDPQALSPIRGNADGLSVWPRSTRPEAHGDVSVGGVPLTEAADRFGTPVYVLDEQEVRERCRTYRTAFPEADIVYAAKAFLCRALAHWVQEEGLGLDVCSAGELALAVTTGFPPENIVMHGNAKSPEDLRTAIRLGVGRIVVDSTSEIARLAAITPMRHPPEGHGAGGPRHRRRMGTPRSAPAPTTRSSACRSRTDPRSTRSTGYSSSRTWNSSACTATSARRSPRSSRTSSPCGAWSA